MQTDNRNQKFPSRSQDRDVLGYRFPVECLEDVLQGKIWAYSDKERRPSKRPKDLADIMRLVEAHPYLVSLLQESLKHNLFD